MIMKIFALKMAPAKSVTVLCVPSSLDSRTPTPQRTGFERGAGEHAGVEEEHAVRPQTRRAAGAPPPAAGRLPPPTSGRPGAPETPKTRKLETPETRKP